MKQWTYLALMFLMAPLLGSCGPKEIGQGSSSDPVPFKEASGADQMRMPMTGANRVEHMLYHYNRPEVMENMQQVKKSQYLRKMGIQPSPEDPEYRAVPKQRSPFRQ